MLLRAMLLQAFYSVCSERQLMERMEVDLSFRWFVGLGADEPVWDASTFSKDRERLLEGDVAARFLATLMARPQVKRLLSSDHFSVDGTMIQAWSSMKSVKPIASDGSGKDDAPPPSGVRNAEADFHGETRTNATHASTTDPEAKLYRKGAGTEARLAFLGHALMENRCGLVVDACLTQADGHADHPPAEAHSASAGVSPAIAACLKPRNLNDLAIEVAVVRPGPIQGDMAYPFLRRPEETEPVVYLTPEFEKVLGKT